MKSIASCIGLRVRLVIHNFWRRSFAEKGDSPNEAPYAERHWVFDDKIILRRKIGVTGHQLICFSIVQCEYFIR